MNADQVERLFIRPGQKLTTGHLSDLSLAVEQVGSLPGAGVRRKVLPWGTHYRFTSLASGGSAPIFEPEVSILGDAALVRWNGPRALIGGVAPKIRDREIFAEDNNGERPALQITRAAFGNKKELGIYFRANLSPDFTIATVEPIAAAELPTRAPYVAHKLALFLRLRGDAITYEPAEDRELFSSQGFFAALREANGLHTALFWMI